MTFLKAMGNLMWTTIKTQACIACTVPCGQSPHSVAKQATHDP